MKAFIKKLTPRWVLRMYHKSLNWLMAFRYGFPAKDLTVILVTGTKGKSSVTEFLYHILTEGGHATTLINGIHFILPNEEKRNMLKMTMPGRGQIHALLAQARAQGATHAVVEATSEGTLLDRHKLLFPNVFVFTNLHPEHIEAHGSFENYKEAKLSIGREVLSSFKKEKAIIANADDAHGADFIALSPDIAHAYSLDSAKNIQTRDTQVTFTYKDTPFTLKLPGVFNVSNALAAITVAEFLQIPLKKAAAGLAKIDKVRGRLEFISAGQSFSVVVDYAHTPDSLKALYESFPQKEKICILGNTGGGRDTWKRPEMARIAESCCEKVILTNEDPYDEDPEKIVEDMSSAMQQKPMVIMDRRKAMHAAFKEAQSNSIVLITGKGTDPYIMGPHGTKTPWDDATVAREELVKIMNNS